MSLQNLPVRSKLALMFVAVCLLTFGVGGYLASASATKVIEGEIMARLEYQSQAYATALDGYLRMLTRRCEDFASDGFIRDHAEALTSGAQDRERIERELRTHLLENKLPMVNAFLDLTLIGREGEILLAARAAPPDGFARRLAAEHTDDGPWTSGFLPPAVPGDHPRLAIATPLWSLDRAERLGDLVAWIHPSVWIVDALRSGGFTSSHEHGEVALQILDTTGQLLQVSNQLTDPNGPLADSELVQSGFGLQLTTDETARPLVTPGSSSGSGRDVFQKSFPMAANGWSVRVALQGEDMLSAAADLQSRILGIGILLSIAASLLFLFPMRFLTRPLLDLAAAARRLAGGDLAARVEALTNDEIGDLGRSFNSMAEAIQERAGRLERTAEDLRTRKFEVGFERDRLQAVIASMRDGLVVLDADGVPVLHNAAAGPLLKQVRSGHSSVSAYHRCENAESTHTECRECLFSPIVGPRSCVVEIDGGVFEIHAARLAPDANGRAGRVLVSRDLTDRVAQDERHIHQERLAVLGEVAAVMAHELNNPLAAISMYNQMLTNELGDRPDLSENVEVIQRNVESCKRTIRDLLDYATNATPEIGSLDVNATLKDVSSFLRPLRERSNVELRMNLLPDPVQVTGDEVQIRQVFVNLIVNAIQAVDSTGGWVSVETRIEGDHAIVLVRDNGPGIANSVREKIFKPFFTTKERGEGTGLGLPTARRIAEMHGGGLELLDEDGPGTVFRVRLRLYQEVAA